jgi:PAS domain S-box-containing protein
VFPVSPSGRHVEVVGCLIADASGPSPADHEARELSAIVASSEDAIISKGLDGTIRSWNAAAERLYGYTAAEAIGRSIALIVPDELASEVGEILREIAANRRVEQYETQRRRKDGTLVDVLLSISPIHDISGRVIAASVIARDVSRRRAAEDALKESERRRLEVLANMLRAEEAERSRIATELHDDTVQVMTASLFALDRVALIARRSDNHQIESAVTLTRATLEEATARTRRLMFELRPAILHEHGLVAAINVLADQTRRETGARTTVSGSPGRYGHDVEELAYRSIQEALSNVRKHAGATEVVITLAGEGAALLCEIADDGRGFDPDAISDRPGAALHAGLDTMVERIRAAGGETVVDTARGEGTRVRVRIPVASGPAA